MYAPKDLLILIFLFVLNWFVIIHLTKMADPAYLRQNCLSLSNIIGFPVNFNRHAHCSIYYHGHSHTAISINTYETYQYSLSKVSVTSSPETQFIAKSLSILIISSWQLFYTLITSSPSLLKIFLYRTTNGSEHVRSTTMVLY